MNLEQRICEKLLEYGDRVFVIEYRGGLYHMVEKGDFSPENFSMRKFYFLCDRDGDNIGCLFMQQRDNSKHNDSTVKQITSPKLHITLAKIEIDPRFRGIHLGDFFMNWMIRDVEQFSKRCGTILPITFLCLKNPITTNFYQKWGAEINEIKNPCEELFSNMIIKNPIAKSEYDGNILAKVKNPKLNFDERTKM